VFNARHKPEAIGVGNIAVVSLCPKDELDSFPFEFAQIHIEPTNFPS
jgi:hypothetical protein